MKWLIAISLALFGQLLSAQENSTETLLEMLVDQGLVIVDDPEIMLLGAADGTLSQGIWSEENVTAFNIRFGYQPTVLPLTRKSDTNTDDETYANTDPNSVYYLYINLSDNGGLSDFLRSALSEVADPAFQDRLEEKGFSKLPEQYIQLWRVKLGLVEPRFNSGYL